MEEFICLLLNRNNTLETHKSITTRRYTHTRSTAPLAKEIIINTQLSRELSKFAHALSRRTLSLSNSQNVSFFLLAVFVARESNQGPPSKPRGAHTKTCLAATSSQTKKNSHVSRLDFVTHSSYHTSLIRVAKRALINPFCR